MKGLRLGIRQKIATVILVCMAPMLTLGVVAYHDRNQTRRTLVLDAQRTVARALASSVETFITNVIHAERAAGAAVTSQPYPVVGIVQLFEAIRAQDPAFLSLRLALPTGHVEASDPPGDPFASLTGHPAFAQVRGGADWAVGSPFQVGGRTALEVAVGIRETSRLGQQGPLTAVIDATIDLSRLRTVLPSSFASETDGVLVDATGRVVLDLRSRPRPADAFRTYTPVRAALAGRTADIDGYRDPRTGARELGTAVPLPSLGWAAVVLVPESSVLESARRAAAQDLVWFLAYAGLGLALAWILGGELSAPILALARGARAIGRGEVGHRVALTRTDELGVLATAFDEMSTQLQRYVTEMNALQAVSDVALSAVQLHELLPPLVRQIVTALQADGGVVWFVEERTGDLIVPAEFDVGPADKPRRLAAGQGVVGRAAATARTLVAADPDAMQRLDPALQAQGIHAAVCVPLRVGGRVIGVIEVFSRSPREFPAQDVRLLETFADRVALAIDNAQAYERQQEIAGVIQRALLPPATVRLPGLAVAGRYRPSREVGGDFYAILPLGDGRVGLAIGDVSGKGIPAATHSARARYLLEAFALEGRRPDAVLERLNQALSDGSGTFVSLFYGILNPAQGMLVFSSAGHIPPIVVRAGARTPEMLDARGLLLGVDSSARYAASEVRVDPGDLLVLFTDGITETRNAEGEEFGDGRLGALLETLRTRSPEEIADRVMVTVERWGGTGASDDQALMVASVVPWSPEGTGEPEPPATVRDRA